MTAITTTAPTRPTTDASTRSLWRTGAKAGVAAAAATTAVAAAALGAGVPLEIDAEQIPLAGFAQLTLVCTAIGVVVAKAVARWAATPRRTFTSATVILTLLSFAPDLTIAATTATKVILMATHIVAAAIVVPALAGRLPERSHQADD